MRVSEYVEILPRRRSIRVRLAHTPVCSAIAFGGSASIGVEEIACRLAERRAHLEKWQWFYDLLDEHFGTAQPVRPLPKARVVCHDRH